jgi:hypothetical protein
LRQTDQGHSGEDHREPDIGPTAYHLVPERDPEKDRHDRIHVGVRRRHRGPGVGKQIGIGGVGDDGAEHRQIEECQRRLEPGVAAHGFAAAQADDGQRQSTAEHLGRRGDQALGVAQANGEGRTEGPQDR